MQNSEYVPIVTGPEAQARRELVAAFRKARRYGGESAPGGFRPAALALRMARERLAARDVARAELMRAEEARKAAAAEGLARRHDPATLAADKARKGAARLESLCSFYGNPGAYGPGTWQGGDSAPESRRKPCGYGFLASAMHGGERGELWAAHGSPDSYGALRNVADAGDVLRSLPAGYYDNPHAVSGHCGDGLCIGVVGQLRGRDGRAAFVAGYRFGGHDDSGTFDLRDIFRAEGREEAEAEEAREEAARRADSMAEAAAEREREYQTAWGAGSAWADAGERLAELRGQLRAALRENREHGASPEEMPKTHVIFREAISAKMAERAELMAERERLAAGDESPWVFYPDADARAAFCEGAGLKDYPA